MAKYYIIKIESVISAFTFSEAGRETTFEWNFPFPQGIAVGDSLLGFLMDPINEARFYLKVHAVNSNSLILTKEFEVSKGVGISCFDANTRTTLLNHTNEIFEIQPDTFSAVLNQLITQLHPLLSVSQNLSNSLSQEYLNKLKRDYNIILAGAPGTGKTHEMQQVYDGFANHFLVTFHQSYSYEEFVEGIKPIIDDNTSAGPNSNPNQEPIRYEYHRGVFYDACELAAQQAGYASLVDCLADSKQGRISKFNQGNVEPVILCIDEINRANVSSVFGELISLIEPSKRLCGKNEMIVKLPYSGKEFGVPPNLYLIGTMNTADRSIQLLDSALRRRFVFKEFLPDDNTLSVTEAQSILKAINSRIRVLLDKDHQIGHAYFINAQNSYDVYRTMIDKVIPLLQEYFYDDTNKVRQVLNEMGTDEAHYFFVKDTDASEAFKKLGLNDDEQGFYSLKENLHNVSQGEAISMLSHIYSN